MVLTWSLAGLANEAAGEVMASVDPFAVTGLFDVPALASRLLVSLDHEFVQTVIELMCGGLCSEPSPGAPRPGTSIDRQFARVAFNLLATATEKECLGFGLGPVTFAGIEGKLDPLLLGKRLSRVAVATLALECRGRRASLRIAFPQPVLDRFKQDVLPAGGDPVVSDPAWTEHFQAEIARTAIRLDALLEGHSLTLGEVAALRVGQVLPLPKTALSRCELRNGPKLLFRCELGQADGRYSLRVDEVSPREEMEEAPRSSVSPLFPSF